MKNRKKERGENVEKERQERRAIFNPNESFFLENQGEFLFAKGSLPAKARQFFEGEEGTGEIRKR